jgi:hypothetical protein
LSLNQVRIIRPLAEAMQWFDKELSWGAQVAEFWHLTSWIGKLWTAMITYGQMPVRPSLWHYSQPRRLK